MSGGTSQGLFTVVAVVIFGIFVSISYFLFYDTLTPTLANIFENSFIQVDGILSDYEVNKDGNYNLFGDIDEDGFIYVNLKNESNPTDIWTKMEINTNKNSLTILSSGRTKADASNGGIGDSEMTGTIKIPANIVINVNNNDSKLKVTKIGKNAFQKAKFTGMFNSNQLEDIEEYVFYDSVFDSNIQLHNVKKVGNYAFYNATFDGDFKAPELESIGIRSFAYSLFPTGDFISPNLVTIGNQAFSYDYSDDEPNVIFQKNMFVEGLFHAPKLKVVGDKALKYAYFTERTPETTLESLETVGYGAFYSAKFRGTFDAKNVTLLRDRAFYFSKFTGNFLAPKLTVIGDEVFLKSPFSGTLSTPNLTVMGDRPFYNSIFTKIDSPLPIRN